MMNNNHILELWKALEEEKNIGLVKQAMYRFIFTVHFNTQKDIMA